VTNSKPKLIVSRKLPEAVEQRLKANYDVRLNADDTIFTCDELLERAQGADGLLVSPTEKCNHDMIAGLPETIKIMATFSVGYDHIDIEAATAARLTVTNTPDVLTDATADIALLLILGAARGAYWGDKMVRTDTWGAWAPTGPLGIEVTGKRLGIFGMGRIGQAVADRARAFNMEIHYSKRSQLPAELEKGAIYHETVESLLEQSQFLSVNCASTAQTFKLLNQKNIALLPDGAVVVNTARGEIIDDEALIEALKTGKLAAAGLDVFTGEPNIDPRYRALDNVFLLPHLGSATLETREAMGMRAVDNLDAFFNNQTPGDLVTPASS
jgi:lactate dehydrogenase-like 2-hydroxyacid dehydrogenase